MDDYPEKFLSDAGFSLISGQAYADLVWLEKTHEKISLKNCEFRNCTFCGSVLDGMKLENCRVFNCNFENARLQEASFIDCTFYDKDTRNGCFFKSADLRYSEFHGCNISMNDFSRARLFQVTIDRCLAQGATFERANFTNTVSRKVAFSAAQLTNTNFRYADFSAVNLAKCVLSGSRFSAAIFTRTNLEEADLTDTEFAPARYDGISLFKADLRNADISGINVRQVDFTGVKIFDWQQSALMKEFGFIVYPDNS